MAEKAKGKKAATNKVAKAKSPKRKNTPTNSEVADASAAVISPPAPLTPELTITWKRPEEEAASFLRFTGGHFAPLLRRNDVAIDTVEDAATPEETPENESEDELAEPSA